MLDLMPWAWALLALAAAIVGVSKTALPGASTISVAIFAAFLPARTSIGAAEDLVAVRQATHVVRVGPPATNEALRLPPRVRRTSASGPIQADPRIRVFHVKRPE